MGIEPTTSRVDRYTLYPRATTGLIKSKFKSSFRKKNYRLLDDNNDADRKRWEMLPNADCPDIGPSNVKADCFPY